MIPEMRSKLAQNFTRDLTLYKCITPTQGIDPQAFFEPFRAAGYLTIEDNTKLSPLVVSCQRQIYYWSNGMRVRKLKHDFIQEIEVLS